MGNVLKKRRLTPFLCVVTQDTQPVVDSHFAACGAALGNFGDWTPKQFPACPSQS